MAYDGNGTYNLPAPQYPAIPGTTILAEDFNTIMADLAAALSLVLVRDGQAAMTGGLNLGQQNMTNISQLVAKAAGMILSGIVTFSGGAVTFTGQPVAMAAATSLTVPATTTGTTAAPGTNNTLLATCEFVLTQAMSAALPAQSLGFLRSSGAVAAFTTTHTGYAQNEVKGANIASAATINLTTATGNFVHVTGTTNITAITIPVGAERTVVFDGILTLTHGAALILPGAANITTAANDSMTVRGDTAGAIVTRYTKANGRANVESTYALVLLATVTPTVAANVDFLNTFSSAYDNYMIEANGLYPSINGDRLFMRFAVAGSVDTGSNYYNINYGSTTTAAAAFGLLSSPTSNPGRGSNIEMLVMNANDVTATVTKGLLYRVMTQGATTPSYRADEGGVMYPVNSAVSGMRLYWESGSNFAAQGKIRIYGLTNT